MQSHLDVVLDEKLRPLQKCSLCIWYQISKKNFDYQFLPASMSVDFLRYPKFERQKSVDEKKSVRNASVDVPDINCGMQKRMLVPHYAYRRWHSAVGRTSTITQSCAPSSGTASGPCTSSACSPCNSPLAYGLPLTLVSGASAIAFLIAASVLLFKGEPTLPRILTSGVIAGTGIVLMHYVGMAALQLNATPTYNAL